MLFQFLVFVYFEGGGAWVAQLFRHPILGFSLGLDLVGCEMEPPVGTMIFGGGGDGGAVSAWGFSPVAPLHTCLVLSLK